MLARSNGYVGVIPSLLPDHRPWHAQSSIQRVFLPHQAVDIGPCVRSNKQGVVKGKIVSIPNPTSC